MWRTSCDSSAVSTPTAPARSLGLGTAIDPGAGAYVVALDRDLSGVHGHRTGHRVTVLVPDAAGSPGERVGGLVLGDDHLVKHVGPLTVTIGRRRELGDPAVREIRASRSLRRSGREAVEPRGALDRPFSAAGRWL
ncbi:hypothetical protein ABZX85_38450 [Streptomyces sp. NPDC004539]|uniref:hypothetical protein n=1 Tax=Streptomyces sp. NPDC004539 TaxID=3154280 RepID=UPI0033AD9A86